MKKLINFDFAILIPVFHNKEKIKPLKDEIVKYLSKYKYFICFVDDSSDNETKNEIEKNFSNNFHVLKRVKKEKFSTRFSASLDGFKWLNNNVDTNYIVEIDSDLAHHPKDIKNGIELLKNGNCDLVIGSKYNKDSVVKNRKLSRIFISKFITLVCKILFDKNVSDYSNTFRFYKLSLVKNFINREIVFKSPIGHLNNLLFIIKSGYQIRDIPTSYIETDAESAIRASSLARYFIEFIRCIIFNKFK